MIAEDLPSEVLTDSAVFTGDGGWESERKRALKHFEVGKSYKVTGGALQSFSSYYTIEGIPGEWNTCLFAGKRLDHLLRPSYKLDYVQPLS